MVPLLTAWAGLSQHEAHGTSLAAGAATGLVGTWVYADRGVVNWPSAAWLAVASMTASLISAQYASRVPGARLRKYFGAFLLVVAVLLPLRDALLQGGGLHGVPSVPALVVIAAVAGSIAGLMGVGGGVLIVPLLVLGTGLAQHAAQGTSLASLGLTGLAGSLVYARHGYLRRSVLILLLPGTVLGCCVGSLSALGIASPALRVVFAAVLVWLGVRYVRTSTTLWRGRRSRPTARNEAPRKIQRRAA